MSERAALIWNLRDLCHREKGGKIKQIIFVLIHKKNKKHSCSVCMQPTDLYVLKQILCVDILASSQTLRCLMSAQLFSLSRSFFNNIPNCTSVQEPPFDVYMHVDPF